MYIVVVQLMHDYICKNKLQEIKTEPHIGNNFPEV